MTNPIPQDELITLAKEAGFYSDTDGELYPFTEKGECKNNLELFAQLIQQRGQPSVITRERLIQIIKKAEKDADAQHRHDYAQALAAEYILAELNQPSQEYEQMKADAERLDFVLSNDAFTVVTATDAGGKAYQLWAQNEDEEYIVLSGDSKFFKTEREEIDAAIARKG